MATYYHGAPEIQPDGLQTLYLMNPASYVGYPDAAAAAPGNMVLLNSSMNTLNPTAYSHNSQSSNTQHLVGIPLHHSLPPEANHPSSSMNAAAAGLGHRLHYNLWTPGPSNSNSIGMASPSQPSPHRPSTHQQGLSLSLSPQHHNLYTPYRAETDMQVTAAAEVKSSNRNSGLQSFLMGSKFLKATQELLDEVVSVGKGSHTGVPAKAAETKSPAKSSRESEGAADPDVSGKRGADLTTAERQELQMKKAKLVNMLDEVEQRYRQYRQQMQIVVSSFESVAGFGSARTYTSLALQTISKQFRCLRDSISGIIRSTSRSLGEEDCSAGGSKSTGSRLRFVDHQLRQQRALQQLGMIQHNAWRPQRGLPERAVSVLRAWLFEHFLHPYPKDADKLMLAKQTGLTRSQVSNWFINARVRLWKPMVEEMYTEEFKEQELNNADEKTSKSDANEDSASKSSAHQDRSPTRTEQTDCLEGKHGSTLPQSVLGIADNHDVVMPPSLKKSRNDQSISAEMKPEEMSNRELLMKFMDGRSSGGYNYMAGAADHLGGFGSYNIGEIGRFGHEQFAPRFSGNGVSLTLGLPHADSLSLSGTQASYLSGESMPLGRRIEMNTEPSDYCSLGNSQTPAHPPNAYGSISIQDRKRYAAQLLPDFVA